jgi:protoporphyrinogen/coproporphyrinogen III oxidase
MVRSNRRVATGRGPDADVLVVGAGVAGLAAADRLRRDGLRALLLERETEPGGRARSEQWEGCALDLGATFVTPGYRRVRRLIEECGMSDRLTPVANAFRVAIRRDGRWHQLDFHSPEMAAVRYRGIAVREKAKLGRLLPYLLRVAASLRYFDVASVAAVDSKSLEDVIGPVANRYFASGLVEVFCGYGPDEVSLAFAVLGGRYPIRRAWTLRGGIGFLTGELGRRSEARCGVAVESVRVEGPAVVAETGDGETLRTRAAILATLAPEALELWPQAPEPTRRFLSGQGYSQGFGVFLRTSAPVRRTDERGRGLYMDMMPRDERTGALLAVIYANELAPDGGLIGVVASPEASAASFDDGELAARLESELTELHPEMNPQITARRTLRWPTFVPTYPPGRARELAAFRAGFAPGPIQLAGDYLYGPMMEAAARAGEEAAERASTYVNEARAP